MGPSGVTVAVSVQSFGLRHDQLANPMPTGREAGSPKGRAGHSVLTGCRIFQISRDESQKTPIGERGEASPSSGGGWEVGRWVGESSWAVREGPSPTTHSFGDRYRSKCTRGESRGACGHSDFVEASGAAGVEPAVGPPGGRQEAERNDVGEAIDEVDVLLGAGGDQSPR